MTDVVNQDSIGFDDDEEKEGMFAVSENFGILLRHYRTKVKDLTLKELSEASKLSESYISRLESGLRKCPSLPTAMRLADCLDINYSVLMATISQPTESKAQNTLSDVLIQNNYAINEKTLSKEAKLFLLKLNEYIVECEWGSNKVRDLYLISEMIDDFKQAI
jgi:transcriptional regulator with XRE-family HTH domain